MLPLFRLSQSKIRLDSGFRADFDSSLHTFQTLPLKHCLNTSPPHLTSSWGSWARVLPSKKASSSDHKRRLTTFTHTQTAQAHMLRPPSLPPDNRASEDTKWGWACLGKGGVRGRRGFTHMLPKPQLV